MKKDGQLMPVHQQQRVLPWWRVNADGSYVFSVRLGSKPVEFEKGKNAIAVPALDKASTFWSLRCATASWTRN